ncbi:MAG: hypothetical protein GF317_05895 [Candidatus Lokiarchaeota archaeon]|nr:hypothetical protein [Candidatus Lokiarchaeota archaeon]
MSKNTDLMIKSDKEKTQYLCKMFIKQFKDYIEDYLKAEIPKIKHLLLANKNVSNFLIDAPLFYEKEIRDKLLDETSIIKIYNFTEQFLKEMDIRKPVDYSNLADSIKTILSIDIEIKDFINELEDKLRNVLMYFKKVLKKSKI